MEVADRPATPWSSATLREVAAGEVLVHEGGDDDDVFSVVEGSFEILRGPALVPIDTVGPGATIGEIAALAGCPRTATVRALEPSVVRQLDGSAHQHWLATDEPAMVAMVDVARSRIDRHRTIGLVAELLAIDLTLAAEVVESSERVHLRSGDVLFEQGDVSDAGYLVVSGRLAASRDGTVIGEIARGEVVGEVGMIERAPRGPRSTSSASSPTAPRSNHDRRRRPLLRRVRSTARLPALGHRPRPHRRRADRLRRAPVPPPGRRSGLLTPWGLAPTPHHRPAHWRTLGRGGSAASPFRRRR